MKNLTNQEILDLLNLFRDFLDESTRLSRLSGNYKEDEFMYVVYNSNAEYLFEKACKYYSENQEDIEEFHRKHGGDIYGN